MVDDDDPGAHGDDGDGQGQPDPSGPPARRPPVAPTGASASRSRAGAHPPDLERVRPRPSGRRRGDRRVRPRTDGPDHPADLLRDSPVVESSIRYRTLTLSVNPVPVLARETHMAPNGCRDDYPTLTRLRPVENCTHLRVILRLLLSDGQRTEQRVHAAAPAANPDHQEEPERDRGRRNPEPVRQPGAGCDAPSPSSPSCPFRAAGRPISPPGAQHRWSDC